MMSASRTLDQLVILASYYSPVAAYLAKYCLEDAGIRAILLGDLALTTYGPYVSGSGMLTLHVAESDFYAAEEILQEFEASTELPQDDEHLGDLHGITPSAAIHCSAIGSTEVTAKPPVLPEALAEHVTDVSANDADDSTEIVDAALVEQLESSLGDTRADRAWKVAIVGLLVSSEGPWFAGSMMIGFFTLPIFLLISLIMVLFIGFQDQPVSVTGRWKMALALTINVVGLSLWTLMFMLGTNLWYFGS